MLRLPSTPILPSPSLSAAFKNALVSLSVRSLPSLAKPFRTNLREEAKKIGFVSQNAFVWIIVTLLGISLHTHVCLSACVSLSHLSSSSSMKPLLSASSTVKTFFTSSADLDFRPTSSKNFLWSKESATGHTEKHRSHIRTVTISFKLLLMPIKT